MASERTIANVKIACLSGAIVHLVCSWIRFALLYNISHKRTRGSMQALMDIATWGIYSIWPALATIYAPIQIYALFREIQHDLLWYKHWFARIYGMYISSFLVFQFMDLAWQCVVHVLMPFRLDFLIAESFRMTVDIADVIVGTMTNVLFIIILFRPLMPNFCFGELSTNSPATVVYSRFKPGGRTNGHADGEVHVSDGQTDIEEDSCCNKTVALIFAIIFYIVYVIGLVTVLVFLSFSIRRATLDR